MENLNQTVTLAGWVQKVRNLGAMTFIDLRDRYGITQLVVEEHSSAELHPRTPRYRPAKSRWCSKASTC